MLKEVNKKRRDVGMWISIEDCPENERTWFKCVTLGNRLRAKLIDKYSHKKIEGGKDGEDPSLLLAGGDSQLYIDIFSLGVKEVKNMEDADGGQTKLEFEDVTLFGGQYKRLTLATMEKFPMWVINGVAILLSDGKEENFKTDEELDDIFNEKHVEIED